MAIYSALRKFMRPRLAWRNGWSAGNITPGTNTDPVMILGGSEWSSMSMTDFFRIRLDSMIDLRHPPALLATKMSWASIETTLAPLLERRSRDGDERNR